MKKIYTSKRDLLSAIGNNISNIELASPELLKDREISKLYKIYNEIELTLYTSDLNAEKMKETIENLKKEFLNTYFDIATKYYIIFDDALLDENNSVMKK